jgi:hypothetical protein
MDYLSANLELMVTVSGQTTQSTAFRAASRKGRMAAGFRTQLFDV